MGEVLLILLGVAFGGALVISFLSNLFGEHHRDDNY